MKNMEKGIFKHLLSGNNYNWQVYQMKYLKLVRKHVDYSIKFQEFILSSNS